MSQLLGVLVFFVFFIHFYAKCAQGFASKFLLGQRLLFSLFFISGLAEGIDMGVRFMIFSKKLVT